MVDVVNKGTARIAKINGINVAGKTGTVENFILIENEKKQLTDHSTFIAFAKFSIDSWRHQEYN